MTWYPHQWIGLWWLNQTVIRENNLDGPVTVFCLIGFVLVPSLAWTVVAPERWLLQIHQAREHVVIVLLMQPKTLCERCDDIRGIVNWDKRYHHDKRTLICLCARNVYG